MANKVLLKKSSVGAKVPVVGDLDYGELALNYTDGKLYYKTASNTIKSFTDDTSVVTLTGTQTLTNKTLTSPVLGGTTISASGNIVLKPATSILEVQGTVVASSGVTQTLVVTVVNPGSGNVFAIDGVNTPILSFVRTGVYTFVQSAASNAGHQIAFKDGSGTSYTTGVVTTGTPGSAGAQTVITVASDAPDDLRYYCVAHGNGMGNTIGVTGTAGSQYIGQIKLNRPDNTNGQTISAQPSAAAATNKLTLPGGTTIGNADAVLVSDTGTQTLTNKTIAAGSNTISGLTNSNLSGTAGITNANLANSSITINGSAVSLGGTVTVTATATNALTIGTGLSGTSFNGSSAVTIAIDSTVATLTGTQTLTNKTLTSPTLTTPALGVATATSINKVAFTAPATGSTLTIADGKTLTSSNSLTFTGTDATSFAFPGTSGTVVTLAATQTLTNKTLTTPIISSISNTGTLTLPTSTDTLVGRATTDTLTNKTLSAGVLSGTLTAGGGVGTNGQVLQSTGTGVQWATVSGGGGSGTVTSIIAGTGLSGGTITTSGTIAIDSTVATLTGTQTLTNKSLTSPIITGTITAGGGVGTSGQVLSSTSTGIQWVDQTGGGGVSGYNNSSLTAFPSGNYNGTDTYIGESGSANDAFGISLLAIFTCMDPVGSLQTTDLGVLT